MYFDPTSRVEKHLKLFEMLFIQSSYIKLKYTTNDFVINKVFFGL